MNVLLIILFVLIAFVAFLLIAALFMKKEYVIERETVVNRPTNEVFDYVKQLTNGDRYNKWVMEDPQATKQYRGADGTVGFVFSWDSKNKKVGKGEQEITAVADNERVDSEIRFIKPFEGKAFARMATESVDGRQTKVKWTFKNEMNYPMNAMVLFVNIPKMLGKDLEASLLNLKNVLE